MENANNMKEVDDMQTADGNDLEEVSGGSKSIRCDEMEEVGCYCKACGNSWKAYTKKKEGVIDKCPYCYAAKRDWPPGVYGDIVFGPIKG